MAEENNQDNQYIIELIEGNKLSKKKNLIYIILIVLLQKLI